MKLKVIACNVFMREVCCCAAQSPHLIDLEFTELGEHVHSETLRNAIQSRIDRADESPVRYDAVLLGYGICGNAGVGLQARRTPLVLPRAHDCCTVLLGSKEAFQQHFADNPSTPFSSVGYMERGEYYLRVEDGEHRIHYGDTYAAYVEQYGEENARYIWETLHPPAAGHSRRAVFIEIPETSHLGFAEKFKARAEMEGKEYVCLPGSLSLIRRLLLGQWDPDDFLVVPPGQQTVGVYDWSEIIRATDRPPDSAAGSCG
jgi:hypothetical protein